MNNYEIAENYRKEQFKRIESVLKKVSEIIAFVRVYGSVYDSYYNAIILNLNNISEHFLETLDSKIIDRLYDTYSRAKFANKSSQEIFEEMNFYNLPVYAITETAARRRRQF